ncbi:MAG: sigma-54-dependent Fis family transcriptional regulator, partial [Candidatus Brocadiae bacterium]|nr:sigma-54-dependent Fis family transcriptional regulator [Candidatus Brocadiia bacterium]
RTDITQTISIDDLRRMGPAVLAGPGEPVLDRLRLNSLLAIAELAASAPGVPALFEGTAQSLSTAVGGARAVPVLEEEDGTLRPYFGSKGKFGDTLDELRIDASVVERCRHEVVAATHQDGDSVLQIASVPICVGERCLGFLYCERADPQAEFLKKDLTYLVTVGMLIGVAIESIRSRERVARRARSLSRQLGQHYNMVGESEALKNVFDFIRKVASTDAGVMICGESGTGKEMVARAIHFHSRRGDGPFEIVNCGAVPVTLMESELFGHVSGAFTGAVADRPGRFELADAGTLLLDEVVELSSECQVKLLRVIEEGKVRKVGDTEDRSVDVRVIAATNRDLEQAVAEGRLREDLFYRLDRLRVVLPPLRERHGDIEMLAEHFLSEWRRSLKRPGDAFAPEVLEVFRSYGWPGNVRELKNVVERMVILGEGPVLGTDLVPDDLKAAARNGTPCELETLRELEKRHILDALHATQGNKKRAAELLGIDRSTLYAKLKRYDITP